MPAGCNSIFRSAIFIGARVVGAGLSRTILFSSRKRLMSTGPPYRKQSPDLKAFTFIQNAQLRRAIDLLQRAPARTDRRRFRFRRGVDYEKFGPAFRIRAYQMIMIPKIHISLTDTMKIQRNP